MFARRRSKAIALLLYYHSLYYHSRSADTAHVQNRNRAETKSRSSPSNTHKACATKRFDNSLPTASESLAAHAILEAADTAAKCKVPSRRMADTTRSARCLVDASTGVARQPMQQSRQPKHNSQRRESSEQTHEDNRHTRTRHRIRINAPQHDRSWHGHGAPELLARHA